MLIISCHADTNFTSHSLKKLPGGIIEGHLDNFAGDYNAGLVRCREGSLDAVGKALCQVAMV